MNINFPRQCGFDLSMDELIHSCRGVRNLRGNLFTTLLVAKVSTSSIIRSIIKRRLCISKILKGTLSKTVTSYVFDLMNSLLFNYYHQYQYNSLTIILLSVKIHKFLYFEQQVIRL